VQLNRVKVTVAPLNVTYDGFLFTADPITNLIVINTRPAPPDPTADYWKQPADLHIIPVCHITSFTVMELGQRAEGAGQGFDGCLPPIGPLDMRAIEAREKATIKKMKEDEARSKAGVTPEGKEVYDALSRT
jgi:protein LSM12